MYANDNVQVTISSLLERGNMFLQDGEWKKAQDYFNRVLDAEPHNADAYLGLCLSNQRLKSLDQFMHLNYNYTDDINYSKAYQFADQTTKARLDAVYSEWETQWNAINSAKLARNAQTKKRAIIVLSIIVFVFSVLYFIVLPMVTNALLSADIISLSKADDIFSLTPYSYNYTIKDGGAFYVPDYCHRLSCINIDTDEAIMIYLSSTESSDYRRIVNRSDNPQIVFCYEGTGLDNNIADKFMQGFYEGFEPDEIVADVFRLQGFDDYVLFVETEDKYEYTLHYYTKDTTELILNSPLSEFEKANISSLKKLEKLELNNAEISDIYFLRENKKLEKLTVKNDHFNPGDTSDYKLDCSVLHDMSLSELRLNGFYFNSIELGGDMTDGLQILDLRDNELNSIGIKNMPKLETLNLSDNKLFDIELSNLPELKSCDISNNSIKRFDISDCEELEYMNLAHSKYLEGDLSNLNNIVLPESLDKLRIDINDKADLSVLADKYPNIQSLILEYHSTKCLGIKGLQSYDNLKELCVINDYLQWDNTESVKEDWIRWLSSISKYRDNIEKVTFGASVNDLVVLKG